ncbi:PAS domain-containing protein [Sphingomonas piscis]|uniref:histidine kinase n=1 Tax=Sphingomonas piscis TaxID=2714943 RepID=A0A6G7YQX1_9SPHN|nr:HWE histidine kinase domain-containing protein [Sphingomonas piscis]QIK79140.1 PAS domain-containing protein [Sphingomonas piscis]
MLPADPQRNGEGPASVRALIAQRDWDGTPIGPPAQWPQSLRTIVDLMLHSRFPMFVAWGPDLTFIYNDAYVPILGGKHPQALGNPFQEIWWEIWHDVGPLADRALAGEATWLEDLPLLMHRHGYDEETWFTFSYSPALDDDGKIAGVFCACTETTEKVLAVRRNAAERHRLEQLFGKAPAFMALLVGSDHVFELANAAYLQLVGHRDIIGKPVRTALPEIAGQGFFELLDQVYATGKPFVGQQVPLMIQRRPGDELEQAYVDFVYQPIVDEAGSVTGIFVTGYEVTALRVAQDRLSIAQTAGKVGTFELFPKLGSILVSEEFCRIWGVPYQEQFSVHDLLRAILPDDMDRVVTGNKDLSADALGYIEYRIRRPDTGQIRWIARRAEAVLDAAQDVVRFAGVIYDITDRKEAELALEAYARNLEVLNQTGDALASMLDVGSIVQRVTDAGVALIGAQFGAFFYNVNDDSGEILTLYTLSGADKSQFDGFGHPRATPVFKPTFDGTANVRSDDILADPRYGQWAPHFGKPKGHLPVQSYLAVPVKARDGNVIGGLFFGHEDTGKFTEAHEQLLTGIAAQAAIAMDNARLYQDAQREIERRRQAETHQHLLINELNHRVKNTLAIVQSLAQQSFRDDTPTEDARNTFNARLSALAAAHNLLTRQNWEQAPLDKIIATSVEAASGGASSRVSIRGDNVLLAPQTAVSVAMAIHELTTNALKYGALSNDAGTIDVWWHVDDSPEPILQLCWEEKGGPPVIVPSSRGFGSRMIERGLAAELRGKVSIDFRPAGVICSIEAPLPALPRNSIN